MANGCLGRNRRIGLAPMLDAKAQPRTVESYDTAASPKRYGIIQIVSDVVHNRLDIADDSVAQHRRHLCSTCEARNATLNLCTACGCHIPAKTKLAKATCPKDFW